MTSTSNRLSGDIADCVVLGKLRWELSKESKVDGVLELFVIDKMEEARGSGVLLNVVEKPAPEPREQKEREEMQVGLRLVAVRRPVPVGALDPLRIVPGVQRYPYPVSHLLAQPASVEPRRDRQQETHIGATDLQELRAKYQDKMAVIAVVVDRNAERIAQSLGEEIKDTFVFLADPYFSSPPVFGFRSTPSTVIIKDGEVVKLERGYLPTEEGRKEMAAMIEMNLN